MNVQHIEVNRIVEDPDQPRKHQSEESLRGLADSIRQHGMLNPITVTPLHNVNRYKIITGERRWRAALMANLDTIPCIVKELDAEERLTEQLIENLQREDLQPIEKAKAIQHVKEALGATNREVARRLGLSERTIGYLLDLLALPEEIGEAVVSSPNRPADGQLTEKHARFLKQLNDEPELQSAVVERIREERLSSDDTGNLVKALKKRPDKAQEILESPTDHLVKFFQGADPAAEFLESIEVAGAPARLSPLAQRILDFLPTLSGIQPANLSRTELRQIEDALTSLKLAVDGLLRGCKEQLGEKV
ncbi:MAG TPA: ParB/RepB/Spo0J family partition protein [Chthonomonadaceae bacterium]|nr:ParB/RepB/Spo0J family partition protein [Chthonomonadaceae bacterium]